MSDSELLVVFNRLTKGHVIWGLKYTSQCMEVSQCRFLLSSWDPRPIAEIPSDPRLTPYRPSDSIPTILRYSNTMLTKTPNSKYPPNPPTHFLSLSELRTTSENPNHIFVFICLHCSISVLLNSKFVYMSSSQFSPFRFWYIKPFQYSYSLILASALPSYISASLLLNSLNSL